MPTISIIIPIYKTKKEFLDKSIGSALSQTFTDIEIILVDDGSPDDCGSICDDYAKRDSRIKVVHKENGGTASARNSGIDAADGDLIMFLDADDWLENNSCEALINSSPSADIVIGAVYQNYDNTETKISRLFESGIVLSAKSELENLQERILSVASQKNGATLSLLSVCGKLYNKRLFSECKLRFNPDVIFSEDTLFNLYAYEYAASVSFIDDYVMHYRYNGESKVNSYRLNADKEQMDYLEAVKAFIALHKGESESFRKAYALRIFLSTQMLLSQKYFNDKNTEDYFTRRKQFRNLLAKEPFASAMKQIKPNELAKNHRIKYLLIRYGFYNTADILRKLYLKKTGKR